MLGRGLVNLNKRSIHFKLGENMLKIVDLQAELTTRRTATTKHLTFAQVHFEFWTFNNTF